MQASDDVRMAPFMKSVAASEKKKGSSGMIFQTGKEEGIPGVADLSYFRKWGGNVTHSFFTSAAPENRFQVVKHEPMVVRTMLVPKTGKTDEMTDCASIFVYSTGSIRPRRLCSCTTRILYFYFCVLFMYYCTVQYSSSFTLTYKAYGRVCTYRTSRHCERERHAGSSARTQ